MTRRWLPLACVLFSTTLLAQLGTPRIIRPEVPGQVGTAAAMAMTCRDGHYAENGRPLPALDTNCHRQPGLTATALAIDVGPSLYVYVDNPPCPGGNTDATTAALARSQLGVPVPSPADMLADLQRRAGILGRDAPALLTGNVATNTARCQLFVLQAAVPASAIRFVEFRAHQNQSNDNPRCFEARVELRPGMPLTQTTGGCAISWSGWQSAALIDDSKGTVVAAVFKNWSQDRTRTGQLWVWYADRNLQAPAAPSGLRIIQ